MADNQTEERRFTRLRLGDGRLVYVELLEGRAHVLDAPPWHQPQRTGEIIDGVDDNGRSEQTSRLAPVQPSKILCVGRNYRAHAAELGNPLPTEPLLFLKPPSSLIGPEQAIRLPNPELSTQVEHEIELGLVIGKRIRGATAPQAAAAIFGYTIVGDITARDLQRRDKQWTRAKGMDSFCPVGPVLVSGLAADSLRLECLVNGQQRQAASSADMVFSPAQIIEFASAVMTLEPGDLIATGTPEGVGPLCAGDRLQMRIQGLGELVLSVESGT